jgi:hypothetical protein
MGPIVLFPIVFSYFELFGNRCHTEGSEIDDTEVSEIVARSNAPPRRNATKTPQKVSVQKE